MGIRKILVPLDGCLERASVLDMALAAGRVLYSQIEVLGIGPAPAEVFDPSQFGFTARLPPGERPLNAAAARGGGRRLFEYWAALNHLTNDGWEGPASWDVTARWREEKGTPELVVAKLGRFADLIVLERPGPGADRRMAVLEAALFGAERPVLLSPPRPPARLTTSALVAWNGSSQSLRALTAALPLLSSMSRVLLVTVGDASRNPYFEEELADYLHCHGVHADLLGVDPDGGSIGDRLLEEARRIRADLLVMGAYSKSRLREAMLGGTTRQIIETAELPVFLVH